MIGYTLVIPTIRVLFGLFFTVETVKLQLNVLSCVVPLHLQQSDSQNFTCLQNRKTELNKHPRTQWDVHTNQHAKESI